MKTHYIRSLFYIIGGLIFSFIIFIIVSPFILVHKCTTYIKANRKTGMNLRGKLNE